MSAVLSISGRRCYGLARVCRVWSVPRAGIYRRRRAASQPEPPRRRPGPQGPMPDSALVDEIRGVLTNSPFHGEGYRKVWARLRHKGVRTSKERVRRLMRENGLSADTGRTTPRGPRAHDGTIIPETVDTIWGTDRTAAVTTEHGQVAVFVAVDHCWLPATIAGGRGADPPAVVYHYAPGRGAEHARTILEGFSGILQVDGYAAYKRVRDDRGPDAPLVLAHCWAHGRRQLREIFDRDASPIAEEGLRRIAEFYAIEAALKGSPPEQRRAVRQARSAPLVEDFGAWLARVRARTSAKSRLGREARLLRQPLGGPLRFLDDGRVEIDSNAVENKIRPLSLQRKNALFAGHDEGAHGWARIASLIETCKLNGVDPLAYLTATLEAIAAGHPTTRLDDLMPWAFSPASS